MNAAASCHRCSLKLSQSALIFQMTDIARYSVSKYHNLSHCSFLFFLFSPRDMSTVWVWLCTVVTNRCVIHSRSSMTLWRLTTQSHKVKPMTDSILAHPPSKSRWGCCPVVECEPNVLHGAEWAAHTSSRFNCLSELHRLLDKWGVLRVKWRVTDEDAQVSHVHAQSSRHHPVEVNSGHYSLYRVILSRHHWESQCR